MQECTRAKLSSRSVINDSAGSAGRTMAEDLENPEDKVPPYFSYTLPAPHSMQFMWYTVGERAVLVSIRYEKIMKIY